MSTSNRSLGPLQTNETRTRPASDLAHPLMHTPNELAREKLRYAAVLDAAPLAIIITDAEGIIRDANRSGEALFKQPRVDLLGRSLNEYWMADIRAEESVDPAAPARAPRRARLRSQPEITVQIHTGSFELPGEGVSTLYLIQDISAQEQFTLAKDQFLMNAAHELRGPVASLRSTVETLLEENETLDAHLSFMLGIIQRAVIRFQTFVESLIDIGNIQAGRFVVRPVPTDLRALLDEAVNQIGPLLEKRDQPLEMRIDEHTPSTVLADQMRVVQVIVNLLTNASKYGPAGQPITLAAHAEGEWVEVEITDRGPGIAADEQAHLFTRFYRGKRAEAEGIGIGLGLALAKEIVEAHGGRIGVSSRLGQGTTFSFRLRGLPAD